MTKKEKIPPIATMFGFEKLEVLNKAISFADIVYCLTKLSQTVDEQSRMLSGLRHSLLDNA